MRSCLFALLFLFSCLPLDAAERLSADELLNQVIGLNRIQEPELDEQALRQQLAELTGRCRQALDALDPEPTTQQQIATLNRVLLADRQVSYQSNLYWRDATLTAATLRTRCNCLAGSVLYVVIGRQLDLPIHMVLVPGHAYARWQEADDHINIETTAGGRAVPDGDYLQRSAISHPRDIDLFRLNRSLDDQEFLAELKRIAASHLRSAGRPEAALDLMQEVMQVFPERDDFRLQLLAIQAEIDHDRQTYRRGLERILRQSKSPGVRTGALLALASEMAGERSFQRQRQLLLLALKEAPKTQVQTVLMALAFCHRSLQDWRGARRYMELAVALVEANDPSLAGALYNLAILQKNDADLPAALRSIDLALQINPESWNLQVIKSGYLVLNGQKEEGLALFDQVEKPRVDADFWNSMQAWFYAVSQQRDRFYTAFEHCLEEADTPQTLIWIQQDVDLDIYRQEAAFKELVERHRARILGR